MGKNKQDVGDKIIIVGFFVILTLSAVFGFSPISYYVKNWNNYWQDSPQETVSVVSDSEISLRKKSFDAYEACKKRVTEFLNVPDTQVSVRASSTSETYETYDCYAIKWTKIK